MFARQKLVMQQLIGINQKHKSVCQQLSLALSTAGGSHGTGAATDPDTEAMGYEKDLEDLARFKRVVSRLIAEAS